MATILMTGSTGAVGQCLVPFLKQRGHRLIHLVRPHPPQSPLDRLQTILNGYISPDDAWWAGNVRESACGVQSADLRPWHGKIDHVVHCAASISFDSSVAEETWETNFGGTLNALRLAENLRIPSFHHISTAYVAGNAPRFTEDDLRVGQTNHNAYEESKLAAEEAIQGWSGGQWTIHRMSIMIGDSRTGWTPTFTGYYGFFSSFWRLLNFLRRKWEEDRSECEDSGIIFRPDGILHLPLRVQCSLTARLNLIPADWFARTVADLIERPGDNRTYHVIHPNPTPVQWGIETSLRHMGITGICYGDGPCDISDQPFLERLQKMLDRGLEPFLPYVTHGPEFTDVRLRETLGTGYTAPPEVDDVLLGRVVDYAIRRSFGSV